METPHYLRKRKKTTKVPTSEQACLRNLKENSDIRKQAAKKLAIVKNFECANLTNLGISESYMSKLSKQVENPQRKTSLDKPSDKTTIQIVNFFNQGDITTNLPDTRRIKNDLQEIRVLDRTHIKHLQSSKTKIQKLITFVRSKPENIETTKFRKWDICLYEVCTNVDLKIRGLSQLAAKSSIDVKVANKYEALDCKECGVDEELNPVAEQVLNANWQHNQFTHLIKTLPQDWVILNIDFAENYSNKSQHEVQSAHWGHSQVTIHPILCFYHCKTEHCSQICQDALIFVSDDVHYDAHAVAKFVKQANNHLQTERGIQTNKEIQFSDGCSAQYKSKTPFTDISFAYDDYRFPIQRPFYGSRHGKGPSDGAGAVVKAATRQAVKGMNKVIDCANDMYEFRQTMKNKETLPDGHVHYKRTFFLVENINRQRPDRTNSRLLWEQENYIV
ncbi:LOW QUALITY PROTEIN: hypothetical protein KUTeg_011643 [Tegillarca granosa]|uniref:Uncharacterized protein n=1 Tax=Tegillarca granosa TaxID=220873 RepID=A0ABQ9F2J8_TEGGR|nr:LOW QUALITY PROTEIN: hypothetical protein KUTeg_011643 [Tegillarca granosa]